jgi:hypothetical protein
VHAVTITRSSQGGGHGLYEQKVLYSVAQVLVGQATLVSWEGESPTSSFALLWGNEAVDFVNYLKSTDPEGNKISRRVGIVFVRNSLKDKRAPADQYQDPESAN